MGLQGTPCHSLPYTAERPPQLPWPQFREAGAPPGHASAEAKAGLPLQRAPGPCHARTPLPGSENASLGPMPGQPHGADGPPRLRGRVEGRLLRSSQGTGGGEGGGARRPQAPPPQGLPAASASLPRDPGAPGATGSSGVPANHGDHAQGFSPSPDKACQNHSPPSGAQRSAPGPQDRLGLCSLCANSPAGPARGTQSPAAQGGW